MNFSQYSKEFTQKANDAGFSNENIQKCLRYASILYIGGFPVIYNLQHFVGLVGYKGEYIRRAAFGANEFYVEYKIKKKSNGYRLIKEPLPSLKEIQQWILKNVLYLKNTSKYSKAYSPGNNLVDNLVYHTNNAFVLSIDIENFFPSIKFDSVEKIFKKFGYSSAIANLFARLCCLDGKLPQGAPTSPYLSNLYLNDFDLKIFSFCREKRIRYTRYSDDLTFSGYFDPKDIISLVEKELTVLGLSINRQKVKLMGKNQRQIVTGVVVNDKMQVPREIRNELRNIMYHIMKYGLSNHLERIQNKRMNYLPHLLGRVQFVLNINPDDKEFQKYKEHLVGLL